MPGQNTNESLLRDAAVSTARYAADTVFRWLPPAQRDDVFRALVPIVEAGLTAFVHKYHRLVAHGFGQSDN